MKLIDKKTNKEDKSKSVEEKIITYKLEGFNSNSFLRGLLGKNDKKTFFSLSRSWELLGELAGYSIALGVASFYSFHLFRYLIFSNSIKPNVVSFGLVCLSSLPFFFNKAKFVYRMAFKAEETIKSNSYIKITEKGVKLICFKEEEDGVQKSYFCIEGEIEDSELIKNKDRLDAEFWGNTKYYFLASLFIIFLNVIMRFGGGANEIRICSKLRTVQNVGGCNVFGSCRVNFYDGTKGEVHKPVKGDSYCFEYSWVDFKKKSPKNIGISLFSYFKSDRMDSNDIKLYHLGIEQNQKNKADSGAQKERYKKLVQNVKNLKNRNQKLMLNKLNTEMALKNVTRFPEKCWKVWEGIIRHYSEKGFYRQKNWSASCKEMKLEILLGETYSEKTQGKMEKESFRHSNFAADGVGALEFIINDVKSPELSDLDSLSTIVEGNGYVATFTAPKSLINHRGKHTNTLDFIKAFEEKGVATETSHSNKNKLIRKINLKEL